MNIQFLLFALALVCFLLDAFRVAAKVNWVSLGFAFIVAALWLV